MGNVSILQDSLPGFVLVLQLRLVRSLGDNEHPLYAWPGEPTVQAVDDITLGEFRSDDQQIDRFARDNLRALGQLVDHTHTGRRERPAGAVFQRRRT